MSIVAAVFGCAFFSGITSPNVPALVTSGINISAVNLSAAGLVVNSTPEIYNPLPASVTSNPSLFSVTRTTKEEWWAYQKKCVEMNFTAEEIDENESELLGEDELRALIGENLGRKVEHTARKWAPLVWLAPGEKFYPSAVPPFLSNVEMRIYANGGPKWLASVKNIINYHKDKIDKNSNFNQDLYLVTKSNVDELLSNPSSILFGENPAETTVPVYARIAECPQGRNHFHVTYWFFFPFSQGKSMCTLDMGVLGHFPIPKFNEKCLGTSREFGHHVGDWEHVSFLFQDGEEPREMYVSAHDAGAFYKYDPTSQTFVFHRQEIRKGFIQRPTFPSTIGVTVSDGGFHPVLFAAKGSHGLWAAPGKYTYVRLPRLYDVSGYGTPWRTWLGVEFLRPSAAAPSYPGNPPWMSYRGKWGNPRSKCHPLSRVGLHFCQMIDGPTGIPEKKSNFVCDATDAAAHTRRKRE